MINIKLPTYQTELDIIGYMPGKRYQPLHAQFSHLYTITMKAQGSSTFIHNMSSLEFIKISRRRSSSSTREIVPTLVHIRIESTRHETWCRFSIRKVDGRGTKRRRGQPRLRRKYRCIQTDKTNGLVTSPISRSSPRLPSPWKSHFFR